MTEYGKLVQEHDHERHLLLILTPDLVEIMYTARAASCPQDVRNLDSWVDQFMKQYVSHLKLSFKL